MSLILQGDKEYFDNILKQIDPGIPLDKEQRRAVITDDAGCLLAAGPVHPDQEVILIAVFVPQLACRSTLKSFVEFFYKL